MAFEFHIWSLDLNLGFKPTSFNFVASCIISKHQHVAMSWACIILCIALIIFLLCCRYLFPPGRRCSDVVIDDTDEELYYLQKCQASKTPLFIPIQSHSLASALFYCIRTTTIHVLHAAVVEPLSSAWPVIATVNRWNPLAWVGVVWAPFCLLIHVWLSCLLLLRVESGLIHHRWIGMLWTCTTVCELSVWTRFGKGSSERPCRSTWWVVSLKPSSGTEFCVCDPWIATTTHWDP